MNDVDVKSISIPECPRCLGHQLRITQKRKDITTIKTVECKFCHLKVTSRDSAYLNYILGRKREKTIEHCLRDLGRPPYVAYINDDVYQIWQPSRLKKESLTDYIFRKTGYEIVIKDAKNVGNGKILDRIA